MSEVIDVALGFDANYAPHAGGVIASIARHAPDARFRFICLHDGVGETLRAKVEACAPGAAFFWAQVKDEDLPAFSTRGHFNRAILFRIGLEKLAPADCARVIYVDSDVTVLGDIRELWSANLLGNAIGAVRDCYQDGVEFSQRWSLPAPPRYFNSGVLVIDLARVRADRAFAAAADFVARHGEDILFGDQDALNWVFWRRWIELDPAWNVQRYMSAPEIAAAGWSRATPALIHYIGMQKPWMANVWHPWAWAYWDNIRQTPFADEIAAANKMSLYQLMRLRLRWWLRRPSGARVP
ncbi:MAG: glycosyltransferase family 8 protein [Hyphomonadaceae bacterium]